MEMRVRMSNVETMGSVEYEAELRTPEERLEEFLHGLIEEAQQLAVEEFSTVTEATRANDKFNSSINERLKTIEGYQLIPVELSGNAVKVPDYEWRAVNDESTEEEGIAIVLKEDALRPLKDLETVQGTYAGTLGSVVQREEGVELYSILVGGIFNLAGGDAREVELGNTGISVMDVMVRARAYVNMVEDPGIVSLELEKARGKYRLADTLAREGLKDALFMKRLHNLGRALHTEDEQAFTELLNPRVFTGIGAAGAIQARQSPEHSALIASTIADTIGSQRRMQFGYKELFEGVMEIESLIAGKVSLVVMPDSEEDETEPAILVDDGDIQKLIPFESITSVKF